MLNIYTFDMFVVNTCVCFFKVWNEIEGYGECGIRARDGGVWNESER